MQELKILDDSKPTEKVYKERGLAWGAFLGGPIIAGYLLIKNYKSLGKKSAVNKALGITIASTIIYCMLAYFFQEVVNLSFVPLAIICMVVTQQVFKQQQAADVETHIQKGGEVYSNWRAVGIGLLFSIIIISILVGIAFYTYQETRFVPTPTELEESSSAPVPARSSTGSNNQLMKSVVASLESKSYGDVGHVIIYNNFFFTDSKIDSIAEYLTALDFFDAEGPKHIYLEKVLFDYEFSITDASADVNTEKTKLKYEKLRTDMELFFKEGKVRILLMDEYLEGVLAEFGEEI